MKAIRSAVAVIISASLILLSPGLGCYQAVANTIIAPVAAQTGVAGQIGAAGAVGAIQTVPGLSSLSPMRMSLSLGQGLKAGALDPQVQPSVVRSLAPAAPAAAPVALPQPVQAFQATITPAPAAVQKYFGKTDASAAASPRQGKQEAQTAYQGLTKEMPSFERMSGAGAKESAETDFLSRIGAFKAQAADSVVAAAGLLAGQMPGSGGQAHKPFASASMPESVELIAVLDGAAKPLAHDVHLSWVDVREKHAMQVYAGWQNVMASELAGAGLGMGILDVYGATPIATYRKINATTLRVPADRADAFRAALEAKGYRVYDNERREIIRPIEDKLGYVRPAEVGEESNPTSMPETLRISTIDKVHEEAAKLWGKPAGRGFAGTLRAAAFKMLGDAILQPKVGVIDTGVDKAHPLIAPGLAAAKDVRPTGDGADDNGHGSWTTSMVMWFAPWLRGVTHYKAFMGGGGTLDDILKALTMAANDGNIIVSNSWGNSAGDPASPDSLMVKKMAEEGRVMVFSAGNNGYNGKNTIGAPGIVYHKDAKTGALRVITVAATDRNKKVVAFSSKGPGSRRTSRDEQYKDYPRKPDAAEQGFETEGAWPQAMGPDRIDPVLGPVRAISGTSMSTPKLVGAIAMLAQFFGVTEVGERLDRVVNAVMSTLTNELNQDPAHIGDGFDAVYAAYQKLKDSRMLPAGPARLMSGGFLNGVRTMTARALLRLSGDD